MLGMLAAACSQVLGIHDVPTPVDASGGNEDAPGDAAVGDDTAADAPTHDAAADDAPAADAPATDASTNDAPELAEVGAVPPCVAGDAGWTGMLDLTTFVLAGVAAYNVGNDNHLTLTNNGLNETGAAWYPTMLPAVSGYDLTWQFRVGPGGTDGEGITFAVLSSASTPGVGANGEGLGLQSITGAGAGTLSGYAVEVVTYWDMTDQTSLGPVTLKLASMPSFTPVAETRVPVDLNNGNTYAVDVSWRAPGFLSATLHVSGTDYNVTSSDAGLAAPSAYLGFTAATGAIANSQNEIVAITVKDTCE
jgi:hypothetical protein